MSLIYNSKVYDLPFFIDGYICPSTSPLQVSPMDALDLLVDFAGLLSCSAAKADPIDSKRQQENITPSAPKVSHTLHETSQPMPEQYLGVMPTVNWTARPQNPPSIVVSQDAFSNQPPEIYNYIWDKRGNLENCEPQWGDGRHFDQFLTEQPGRIQGSHEYFDSRCVPPWTSTYAFKNNVPIFKDTRPPYQHARTFHGAEESMSFASPGYRPFESRCTNDGCDCQAYGSRFANAVNEYVQSPMDEHHDTGAAFRNSQVWRTYDPRMAVTINEEQLKLSQAQRY
jgi:hypothetical protein